MNKLKRVLAIATSCFVLIGGIGFTPVKVQAAQYTVTSTSAVLYTGNGAELFIDANPTTCIGALSGDLPVLVTGMTNNGFFQVNIDNVTYYMYGKALSTLKGTTAYTLTNVSAKAALVANSDTGELIYAQDEMNRLEPASTTKIMTALLVMEAVTRGDLTLDKTVKVSKTALSALPSDASHISPKLRAGEIMNIYMLLEAMLIESDCYASNVLAEAVSGSMANFKNLMNTRAAELGCVDTHFVNASGYPALDHYTNAYSLFLIAREAMKYPIISEIVAMSEAVLPATNLQKERKLKNTNALITNTEYYNPNVTGFKTGSAKRAGQCLVASASDGNKNIITVVLGASSKKMVDGKVVKQQYAETNKLIEIGFAAIKE